MTVNGFICTPRIYRFEGWIFEYHRTSVWPLKKDFMPRKRAGDKFYDMIDRFCELSENDREMYRIGGGCQQF